MLLQACLGMTIDAPGSRIIFRAPALPEAVRALRIRKLRIGTAVLDLDLVRGPWDVSVNVVRREGEVEVLVAK